MDKKQEESMDRDKEISEIEELLKIIGELHRKNAKLTNENYRLITRIKELEKFTPVPLNSEGYRAKNDQS